MSHDSIARPVPSAPAVPAETPSVPASESLFDAEKLDAYRVALEFQALASVLLPRRGQSTLRDQLDRASTSILLNTAEGAGRFSPPDKAHFYSIARGSTTECAAILDLLLARGLTSPALYRRGRALLLRLVQMLTKLMARMAV